MATRPVPTGPPRIALKLTPAGQRQQKANPEFIAGLIYKVEPELGLIVSANPLITSQPSSVVAGKVALGAKLDPKYEATDFDAWYQVVFEPQISITAKDADIKAADNTIPDYILKLIQKLHFVADVETVHALQEGPPPVNPTDDPRSGNEGYLGAAPGGIDARYAWGFPGGDGAGANVVDMEQGWDLNHEDLAAANISLISGTNSAYFFHGTSVLGEMLMVDNKIGGVGIAPSAKGRVISQYQPGGYNTAAAIIDAVAHMSFGDVLILEAQETDPVGGLYYWPVEIADATYEAIRLATALGITVVQAACNGGYDLDTYVNLSGKQIFNRSSKDFRDSGAIMVGAGSSVAPHTKLSFSNHGSRVDAYGWGENVDTTSTDAAGTDNTLYTTSFNGTSSATPIVTGAAMIVQGLANASLGYKLSPLQVRKIVTTGGTDSKNTSAVDRIGLQPNLKAIIDGSYINLAPDVYIRDQVGDIGNATSGVVSASPDIVVRQQPVANPQTAFGQGSGTENNSALSQSVLAGRNHSIYIRLLNRGGSPAASAKATVYWSPPATLVTPNLWNHIGSVSFPSVPTGRILTVSPRLAWPAAGVPPTGHYCFVAIAGANDDPAPNLPNNFPDWAKFVQNNNNVAWRNFNVIPAPPSGTGRPFHKFPFKIPGAFDAPRKFAIKGLGSLPRASQVLLRAPLTLAHALGITLRDGEIEGDNVLVPLHPFGAVDIGEGILAVGSSADCELHVRVPVETYKQNGQFEFGISQEWEGIEVGRLTYRFGPEASLGKGGKGGDGCGGHDECGCGCHHGGY
jgi:serine protease